MKHVNLLIVISLLLITFSCSKKSDNVKVGVMMPLTGDVATLGVPAFNGIKLAVEDYNNSRKQNEPAIELIVEDTKAEPKTGVSSINKLITYDEVKVILGPLTSTVTLAVAPIAEKNKTVLISPGASAPKITAAGDYIFRNELSDLEGGRAQAKIAYDSLNYRNIFIVYINTDYGKGIEEVFENEFLKIGGKITGSEGFNPGNTDFRGIISKIQASDYDTIFLVGIDEMVNFIQQIHQQGISVQIYTTPIFENKEYLKKLGSLAEGIIYIYYGTFNPESSDRAIKGFVVNYYNRFNTDPTYYSALAYDATNIILEGLQLSDYELGLLSEKLYEIKQFPGITGTTTFDTNGDVTKPVLLKTVRDGQFIYK